MIEHPLANDERLQTPLRELMTSGVVSVPDSASLARAVAAMRAHRLHAILVVAHDSGAALGWITSRALLAHATADLALCSARAAVDEPAVALPPSATAAEAIEQMLARGTGRVAVRRDDATLPEGVVTDLDLVDLLGRR